MRVWDLEKYILQEEKKMWKLFEICLLNCTANSVKFGWKWAELAVLPHVRGQIKNNHLSQFF